MNFRPYCAAAALFCGVAAAIAVQPANAFPQELLKGWWAESYNTDMTCGPQNLRVRHELSADGKRLFLRFDRMWKTELGETDKFEASVVSASARTVVIRYDNESRKRPNGQLVEWELSIVAPGVYRWHETGWEPKEVNMVVGIRCAD